MKLATLVTRDMIDMKTKYQDYHEPDHISKCPYLRAVCYAVHIIICVAMRYLTRIPNLPVFDLVNHFKTPSASI